MRAAPADFFAPIVAFPKKRRRGEGANGGERQRPPKVGKGGKGGKNRQRSLRSQCPILPPMPPFASQWPPLPYPRNRPLASPATPSHAHPPKTQDSFIKRIPSPYSGVPYRAPFKYARCARLGVNSYSLAGASATALFVYSCIQMFTDVPFA